MTRKTLTGCGRVGFSPLSISGLALWLKADAGLYQDTAGTTPAVANGDPVGRWVAVTGQAFVAPSDAARPTLRTNSGKPYLEWDGSDDRLNCASLGYTMGGANSYTLACHFYATGTTAYTVLANYWSPAYVLRFNNTTGALGAVVRPADGSPTEVNAITAGTGFRDGNWHTGMALADGSGQTIRVIGDGSDDVSQAVGEASATATQMTLGYQVAAGTGKLTGRIDSVTCYSRVLVAAEIALLHSYLLTLQ